MVRHVTRDRSTVHLRSPLSHLLTWVEPGISSLFERVNPGFTRVQPSLGANVKGVLVYLCVP